MTGQILQNNQSSSYTYTYASGGKQSSGSKGTCHIAYGSSWPTSYGTETFNVDPAGHDTAYIVCSVGSSEGGTGQGNPAARSYAYAVLKDGTEVYLGGITTGYNHNWKHYNSSNITLTNDQKSQLDHLKFACTTQLGDNDDEAYARYSVSAYVVDWIDEE